MTMRRPRLRLAAWGFAAGIGTVAVGLGLVAASGIYNVAATKPHFRFVDHLIEFALRRSISLHSLGVRPPDLTDPALARLGREHFVTGCAPCHSTPGHARHPIARGMLPSPPRLEDAAGRWETRELFWIVRHGLKFTGMPAWTGRDRDDEVWAVVAYLQQMPHDDDTTPTEEKRTPTLAFGADEPVPLARCAACHGDGRRPPVHTSVPILHGQKEGYLARALSEYHDGRRQSGIMEPLAAALSMEDIGRIARQLAEASPPAAAVKPNDERVARGRQIFLEGVPRQELPACRSCHAPETSGQFPLLDGLPGRYVEAQLGLFRSGVRSATTHGRIMSVIAERLSPEQIADIAAFLDSGGERAPVPAEARGEGE